VFKKTKGVSRLQYPRVVLGVLEGAGIRGGRVEARSEREDKWVYKRMTRRPVKEVPEYQPAIFLGGEKIIEQDWDIKL